MSKPEILFERKHKNDVGSDSDNNNGSGSEDTWDDTELIQAYDKAVKLAHDQVVAPDAPEAKGKKWKVGDKCKCRFSEDNEMYEADIIRLLNHGRCVIRYVGYENEEKVPTKRLKASDGDMARCIQIQQALHSIENNENNTQQENVVTKSVSASTSQTTSLRQPKSRTNKKNLNHHHEGVPLPPMFIPPPPPPLALHSPSTGSETEALNAMLMSWYMSGYHTGYYQGIKDSKH